MQTPKDIVVYLDNVEDASYASLLHYAASLAGRWQAHVAVAFVPRHPIHSRHAMFARGGAVTEMLKSYEQHKQESLAAIARLLAGLEAAHSITTELRDCEGQYGEALMLHARHAALAVLGASHGPDRPVSALTLSEGVIFASGSPSILVPSQWEKDRPVDRIVVGWNASREAARAISDAMPLLARAREVRAIVVPEPKIANLLGADPGTDVSRHLARYGVPVVLERLEGGEAGKLILSRSREIDADLVVMGAFGQPKITEFVFGSATRTLLKDPEIPILLSR